jgi:hypothetical protein
MPCDSCPIEKALEKTKSRRSNRGKYSPSSPCDVNCCVPESELDCCSLPYQRLEKLRTSWSIIAATGGVYSNIFPDSVVGTNGGEIVGVNQRNGSSVLLPDDTIFGFGTNVIDLASGSSGSITITADEENAYYGYLFVQTHRYVNFESCGKKDQVVGWYVNTSTGQLQLFQNLPDLNLTTLINRYSLDSQPIANLTSTQKQQLYALNVLYKASLKAIVAVQANPKTEGNIVQVTDKCGQKWLFAINRAGGNDVCEPESEFVIVAIPLC